MSLVQRRGAPRRGRRGDSLAAVVFLVFEISTRGGGKVGNLLLVFHFSIRPRRRSCGNVGISPALGEIPKGLVERVGSLPLGFHAFHSPGISTAHSGLALRAAVHGGSRINLSGVPVCSLDWFTQANSPGHLPYSSPRPRGRRPALTAGQPPSAMPSLAAARSAIDQEQMTSRSHLATARTGPSQSCQAAR